jgi:septal ring factor EnvC (AmiA/AmiB activator)
MTKWQQLEDRIREQATEVANLHAALDVQFKRIAQMQAELDQLPQARKRRQMLRATLTPALPSTRR